MPVLVAMEFEIFISFEHIDYALLRIPIPKRPVYSCLLYVEIEVHNFKFSVVGYGTQAVD